MEPCLFINCSSLQSDWRVMVFLPMNDLLPLCLLRKNPELCHQSSRKYLCQVGNLLLSAKSFANQRPFYESNPELFRHRLVTETMQRVLINAVDVFYLSGRQPRIWLNRTPEKPKLKEGGAP